MAVAPPGFGFSSARSACPARTSGRERRRRRISGTSGRICRSSRRGIARSRRSSRRRRVRKWLAKRGLVEEKRLRDYKGLVGYRNVANDLQICVVVAREAWAKIENKTTITTPELDRGELLVSRIVELTGVRDQAPATVASFARDRQRAVTLLLHAYDEARRAVAYVRWREGDVDAIAPSLFSVNALKNGSPRPKADAASDVPAAAMPTASVAAHDTVGTIGDPSAASVPGAPRFSPFSS